MRAHHATQTAIVAMQLRTLIAQPADPGDRDHEVRRLFYAINVTDAREGGVRGALRRIADQRLRALGGDDAADRLAGRRPAPLAVDRPAVARPDRCCCSTTRATRSRRARSARSSSRARPAATSCSATTATRTRPPRRSASGRLHTGDNAYADEDGYLYFFDRKKDMIKRAGENVSAIEVEAVLVRPSRRSPRPRSSASPTRSATRPSPRSSSPRTTRRALTEEHASSTAPEHAVAASRSRPSSPSRTSCRRPRSARSARTSCASSSRRRGG